MKTDCVFRCAFSLLLLAGGLFAAEHPLGLNENHPYGRLTSDYATPHVAWGNPYYTGRIRALVLAPTWSQRETVELAQRLALDYTPWMTATFHEAVRPASPDPSFQFFQPPPGVVEQVLKEGLQKSYDVIIIGKLDWKVLPARNRLRLLEKVSEGSGLVYINPPQPHKELEIVMENGLIPAAGEFILGGVPVAELPAFRGLPVEKIVKAAQFGKGRVVILDYAEKVPAKDGEAWPCLTPAWDTTSYSTPAEGPAPLAKLPEAQWVPYEYYHSIVAKAVVWAAQKESPVKIRIAGPSTLPWSVAGKTLSVTLSNAPEKTVLKAIVRDRFDRAIAHPLALEESRGDGGTFILPSLPCGEYFIDVWAMTAGGKATHTWHSRHITVTDDFVFGDLSLKPTNLNAGDTVAGTLSLPRPLDKGENLTLDLGDNLGRRLLSRDLPVAATNVAFSAVLPPPLTTLHRLDVRLMRSGNEVARKTVEFPVRCRRRWDDFTEVVWSGAANNYIPCAALSKLAHCDEGDAIDIGWAGATVARNIARADAWSVPYTARYGCFGGTTNHIIPPNPENAYGCMSHPVTFQQLQKWGELQSSIFGPYGPLAWTHGDETSYSGDPDVCWCEHCLAVFHNYLQSVYPNLEALNAEWKTGFKSWKEVRPVTFKEAREKKVYAPWVEHCLANDRIFAAFFRKSSEALAAHDLGNRAGFDGCGGIPMPNSGIDWWRLSRNAGILQDYFYNEESTELIRSFGRPDQLRGQWYGTYGLTWQIGPNTVPYCYFFPWNALFHGMNSTWFWLMGAPGPLSGYAPDLVSLPFFAARTEALKAIKTGVGKLLLNSKRVNDGIAIHFSEASRIANALYASDNGDGKNAYSEALADVNRALEYAGLQYQYLSYEQVEQGELAKQGYKVFIMPHSRSVSDTECKAIREFVRNGGVVIADILPAILNGHGTPQAKSPLADLFPNENTGVINSIGKGKTALIGDLIKGCGQAAIANSRGWKALGDQSEKLAELLAQAGGIQPAVRVIHRSAGKMPPTEITRFQAGSIQFVGLLRNYWLYDNNAHPATITFPAESHLYDAIVGKYLGSKKEITGEISCRAQLYALSPYRVRAVELRGPSECVAGAAAAFSMQVRPDGKAAASKHVFHVAVVDPDGRNLRHYAANVLAENGSAEVTIPWALNDRPGSYTITARDVMSGMITELRVKLEAGKW